MMPRKNPKPRAWIATVFRWSLAFSLVLMAGLLAAEELRLNELALQQLELLAKEKASRTPAERKIDSNLLQEMKRRHGPSQMSTPAFPDLQTGIEVESDDTVLVDIKVDIDDALLRKIEALGGQIISSFPQDGAIRAGLPLAVIDKLAESPAIRSIRPAERPMPNKINTSEGDVAHNADIGRYYFGVTGAGIRVGVISDSVDSLEDLRSSGDLPPVTVLSGQSGIPATSEGTAMLEIVHDLAPNAQLFFATYKGGPASTAQNIRDLRFVYDCDIIVDDLNVVYASPFQDDVVARAVNDATADGALYFSSAGNSGNKNDGTSGVWEGDYIPSFLKPSSPYPYDSFHRFGSQDHNTITKTGNGIVLFWSDPLGGSSNDYDLLVFDPTLSNLVCYSDNTQDGDDDPIESIPANCYVGPGYHLVIARRPGAQPRFLHLNTNGGKLTVSTAGQTGGHSAAENAFSVAAVDVATAKGSDFRGGVTNPVRDYSSDGPRRMFYKADGTPYTPGNFTSTGGVVRKKPDIAAADGVATATPSFNPFYGTSAAAPHAAGIAALMLEADPSLTNADDVRDVFAMTALDIEAPGVDRDSGYGIIMAERILDVVYPIPPPTYIVSPSVGAGGNVSPPTPQTVNPGTTESFSVTANAGYTRNNAVGGSCPKGGWTGNTWTTGAINANCTVNFSFTASQTSYSVTPSAGAGGSISPTAAQTVPAGAIRSFTATTNVGYTPSSTVGGTCPKGGWTGNTWTTGAINTNCTVSFSFHSVKRFNDVPPIYWAWPHIVGIADAGITTGCGSSLYCPENFVTRAEMAAFLLRGIHGSSYTPPAPTGTRFSDVARSYWAAGWIEQLATEGVTLGCGGSRYCPEDSVTRAEMAVFLLRSKYGSSYSPPAATGTRFKDVLKSYWAASWIENLAAEGVTTGCGGGYYCPDNSVTRAEMAVFLARTFNLPLPPRP